MNFYHYQKKVQKGIGLDRSGKEACEVEVIDIKSVKAFDQHKFINNKGSK